MLPLEQNNRLGVRFVVHAVALALLLLGVVTYFLAIQHPLLHQHRDALARSEQLVALLSDAARVRHAHFKSEKQLAELLNNVRRVRQCTPETADDAHFLSELVQLAEVDGLQLVDYRR